jgi:sugar/nucleoside kinase (ribokinase family)
MTPNYVTLGGVVLDSVISANGEVNHRGSGGNSLYSAVGAKLWGKKVAAVGRAARDYPKEYLEDYASGGIDVSAIQYLNDMETRHSFVQFDEFGNRSEYNPDEVPHQLILSEYLLSIERSEKDAAIHNQRNDIKFDPLLDQVPSNYYEARGFHVAPMSYRSQLSSVQELNKRSIDFTLDPGRLLSLSELEQLLIDVPVFLPSKEDIHRLLGKIETDQAIKRLAKLGPQVVAIKLGRLGSVVYDTRIDRQYHIPVYPTHAKDPTGAGDAYCGGFLVGWTETGDAFEAALRATVSASFVVENFDARYALRFDRQEAEKRLCELRTIANQNILS